MAQQGRVFPVKTQLPTKPGTYYWRKQAGDEWELWIVLNNGSELTAHRGFNVALLPDLGGQWLPIPTADELVELQAKAQDYDEGEGGNITTNRPPSCDLPPEFYSPNLKPCPYCGSTNVELQNGYDLDELRQYARCNSCDADGPWSDDERGTKWNSLPRRSEVLQLLRLVGEVASWDETIIDTHNYPEDGLAMKYDFRKLQAYAEKLRKQIGE